jgi:AmmeMemoRadiSam system protein B
MQGMAQSIRRAAVAGSWYPSDPKVLASELDAYLSAAGSPSVPGRVVGLISPHAGLFYSGPVAAYGYALLRGARGLTVILVGPSHRVAFEGLALSGRSAWETPFGVVPVDADLAARLLAASPLFIESPRAHADEHSLEMQMPFLAHLVADLRIVPVLMGTQSRAEVETLADALAATLPGTGALLVASSDLSHFHPARTANAMDAVVVDHVEGYDDDGLMDTLEVSHEHACGGGPMVAVMKAARALGATRARVLRYADSGDVGPLDKSRVVGYLSAALLAAEV